MTAILLCIALYSPQGVSEACTTVLTDRDTWSLAQSIVESLRPYWQDRFDVVTSSASPSTIWIELGAPALEQD